MSLMNWLSKLEISRRNGDRGIVSYYHFRPRSCGGGGGGGRRA